MAGPQWVRLDVAYFSNPKVLRASREAVLLHLASVCYLGAHELDSGILPASSIPILAAEIRVRYWRGCVEELTKVGLWHAGDGGDYVVHDYDRMNGALSEAAASRRRQARRRARQRAAEDEPHP